MLIPRVYFAQLADPASVHPVIELPEDESHYLMTVLRLVAGEPFEIFDGRGGYATAEINGDPLAPSKSPRGKAKSKQRLLVRLTSPLKTTPRPSPSIHLFQGLATGDKMDWIIEKAVELGVTDVTPLQTERSTMRLDSERADKKREHWQHVALAACRQSGQNWRPQIHPVVTPSEAISALSTGDSESRFVWFASPKETRRLADYRSKFTSYSALACFIGPESGFSERELALFHTQALAPLSLGNLVLRTETAGLAWLAGILALNGVQ